MRTLLNLLIGVCLLLSSGCAGATPGAPVATLTPSVTPLPTAVENLKSNPLWAPWPTQDWATAAPEQVGMDSSRLLTLLDFLPKQDLDLHSLLVIRHGYLVFEVNVYPTQAITGQDLQSCTKSITSTLVGLALQQGLLKSLDQKVLDFFPGRTFANFDERKLKITLRDLLTMTTGLDWPESTISYGSRDNPARAMWSTSDPVQYILDRPMVAEPGTQFNYNTGASQLLGAILEQVSGQKLADYANQQLFDPLGINNFTWRKMKGIEPGGAGLVLPARDMAKLGYLYLRVGQWENRQLVPPAWITASTHKQVETASHGAYGYQWWLDSNGSYSAVGFGGQSVHVYPDKDLVVVVTGAMSQAQRTSLRNLVDFFVVPAVVSDGPLPVGAAAAELQARLKTVSGRPAAHPVGPLPAEAKKIAGQTYTLETNSLYWKRIKFEFSGSEALLIVERTSGTSNRIPVGLDGVPRYDETLRTVVEGSWDAGQTFTLHYEILGEADGRTLKLEFEGNQLLVTSTSYVQGDVSQFKGTAP